MFRSLTVKLTLRVHPGGVHHRRAGRFVYPPHQSGPLHPIPDRPAAQPDRAGSGGILFDQRLLERNRCCLGCDRGQQHAFQQPSPDRITTRDSYPAGSAPVALWAGGSLRSGDRFRRSILPGRDPPPPVSARLRANVKVNGQTVGVLLTARQVSQFRPQNHASFSAHTMRCFMPAWQHWEWRS